MVKIAFMNTRNAKITPNGCGTKKAMPAIINIVFTHSKNMLSDINRIIP